MEMFLNAKGSIAKFMHPSFSPSGTFSFGVFLALLFITAFSLERIKAFRRELRRNTVKERVGRKKVFVGSVWMVSECASFLLGWGIMMATMTANVYVLLSVLGGILLERTVFSILFPLPQEEEEEAGCCV